MSSNNKTLIDESLSDTPRWINIIKFFIPVSEKDATKKYINDKLYEWDMDWVKGSPNGQGYADGDAIESLVNALAKTFGVDSDLKGDPNGNTWYLTDRHNGKDADGKTQDFSGRTDLHNKLRELSQKIESYQLGEDFTLKPLTTELTNTLTVEDVRNNFGYLVALQTLSPFALVATNKDSSLNKVWADVWKEEYQQWQQDNEQLQHDTAKEKGNAATYFSDQWITDRIKLLNLKSWFDFNNLDYRQTLNPENMEKIANQDSAMTKVFEDLKGKVNSWGIRA